LVRTCFFQYKYFFLREIDAFFQPIIHDVLCTDIRDIDEKRRNGVIEKVQQSAIDISKTRGVKLSEFKIINQDPPALSDKLVVNAMEFAAKQLALQYKLMISRAYHDSLFMAR
jgi:ureidoglycolate amidohydrolase